MINNVFKYVELPYILTGFKVKTGKYILRLLFFSEQPQQITNLQDLEIYCAFFLLSEK